MPKPETIMTDAIIHPSAIIEPGAQIGAGCQIGPYCILGARTVLAENVTLQSHVVIEGDTRIGRGTKVAPFTVIGGAPQHLAYKGEPTRTVVGADCDIREHVTIHRGMPSAQGLTQVGDRCLLMAQVHVAHDCFVGNEVIIASQATLGGHVHIGDNAVIGGIAGIHQFVRIGARAMVGGCAAVSWDVIPFGMCGGNHARLAGLNLVGMRRSGMNRDAIVALRAAFRALFLTDGPPFRERLSDVESRYGHVAEVMQMLGFIRADASRKVMSVSRRGESGEAAV
jgi:UDP-N-acetylglucosamine acyltransferase